MAPLVTSRNAFSFTSKGSWSPLHSTIYEPGVVRREKSTTVRCLPDQGEVATRSSFGLTTFLPVFALRTTTFEAATFPSTTAVFCCWGYIAT